MRALRCVCVYFRSLRVRVCVCAKPFANSAAIRASQPIAGEEGTLAGPGAVMTASAAVIPSHFARRSTTAPPPPLWLLPTKEIDEGCTQETKERCCARGCSRPLAPPPRGAVSVVSLLRLTIPWRTSILWLAAVSSLPGCLFLTFSRVLSSGLQLVRRHAVVRPRYIYI